jgi:3-hydroxyisobutyrate dehydrogenase-like beta-hydroxyacid dehydrogenase
MATPANHLLGEVALNLPGKLWIQLTTGRPRDTRASETWAYEHGVEFLDCALSGSSSSTGTHCAHILLADREDVLQKTDPTLRILASNLDYKAESIGLVSAWDMVFIMSCYGMLLSLFHGV